jgi:hypothetical protein
MSGFGSRPGCSAVDSSAFGKAQGRQWVDCGQISLGSEQPPHSENSQHFTRSVASRPTAGAPSATSGHASLRRLTPGTTVTPSGQPPLGRTRSKRSDKPDCQRISEAANRKRYANAGRRANRMGATDAGLSSARHRSTVRSMIKWCWFFCADHRRWLAALFESEWPPSLERWCDRRLILIARSHVPTTRFQSS